MIAAASSSRVSGLAVQGVAGQRHAAIRSPWGRPRSSSASSAASQKRPAASSERKVPASSGVSRWSAAAHRPRLDDAAAWPMLAPHRRPATTGRLTRTASSADEATWAWTPQRRRTVSATERSPIGLSSWRCSRQPSACGQLTLERHASSRVLQASLHRRPLVGQDREVDAAAHVAIRHAELVAQHALAHRAEPRDGRPASARCAHRS